MKFDSFKLLVAGAALLATGAGVSQAAGTVNLTLQINTSAHTWQAFADVEDAASAGLAGIQFDVTASGGVTLGTTQGASPLSFNDLPVGNLVTGARSSTPAGFFNFTSAVDLVPGTDLQFRGGQTGQYQFNTSSGHGNIVLGFGKAGQSGTLAGDTTLFTPWSFPAIIADGTYSGNAGALTISAPVAGTSLLPGSATVTSGQLFSSHLPDAVNGQTAAVPEPAALGLLGVVTLMVGSRTRRKA